MTTQDDRTQPPTSPGSPTTPREPPSRPSSPNHDHETQNLITRARSSSSAQQTPRKPPSWRSLPRKDQLVILTLIRLAEPVTQTSLQAYMFFMLKSFDAALPDDAIAAQAGYLTGCFTAAQCVTAVWWGRLADKEWVGRKNVLLVGLVGTMISTLGFGFSTGFWQAMFFRSLGGALNGNVGVMRTMISEIIKEKKYQAKAFLILPVTFNVGVLFGPLLGGWLQDPINSFPDTFGPGSGLGGESGVQWMKQYPYALPNIVTAAFLFLSIFLALFGLEETLLERMHRKDYGLQFGRWLARVLRRLFRRRFGFKYTPLHNTSANQADHELTTYQKSSANGYSQPPPPRRKLPYRRIFTSNVLATMLAHGLLHMHTSAFNNLWFLFLSTPRFDPKDPFPKSHKSQSLPFSFTGGLGLQPSTIGFAIGIIGFLGITLQLGIYSRITYRLGVVTTFRYALMLFPLVYAFIPFLAVVPTVTAPPAAADGVSLWAAITALLFGQVISRTFSLPITQILVNNCTPHPSVLGAVHGIGQSVSSGCRTLGPVVWSTLYGVGLGRGVVGLAWWVLAVEAVGTAAASWLLREGTGHEILLEGEEEEDDDKHH